MSHRYKQFVNLLTLCLFCITCSMPIVHADTLTIPNTFTAGTPAQASQVNANFNAVTSWSSTIANDNIKSGAAIAPSKLDLTTLVYPTSEWFFKRSTSNRCVSSGVSTDTVPRVTLTSDGYLHFGPGGASAVDIGIRRKSSSFLQVIDAGATANNSVEASGFEATTFGDANPKLQLNTTGLHFGPGGASAVDTLLKRASATTLAVRNEADSADAALTIGNLTASGTVEITGATTLNSTLTSNALIQGIQPGGRLTLISGTPVTGDVTGAGTLYYTPYVSNIYPAYSNSTGKYTAKTFTEASLTLSISSGTNYDIFGVYTSGSSPTLSAVAWTNDTTRATALVRSGTTGGLLVKNGDAESLYLGTIRGSGANVTEDSASNRFVWNMYNRVSRRMYAVDAGSNYTYTLAAFREVRAGNTPGVSRCEFVTGLAEDSSYWTATHIATNSTTQIPFYCGISLDGNATPAYKGFAVNPAVSSQMGVSCGGVMAPQIGRHYVSEMEYSQATGTCTWWSSLGATTLSGILAM